MNQLELLEDLGNVEPAEEETIDAAVELVLTAAFQEQRDALPATRRNRRRRQLFGRGALAAAAAVAIVVAVIASSSTQAPAPSGQASPPSTAAKVAAPVVLTAAMIRRITSSSAAALASSGTATVTTTTTTGSQPPEVDTTDVTFSGEDLNYSITTSDNPNATAINRLVDGQLYLYVIGQDLHYHWYHDTSANAGSSLAFPDPRTLVSELTPQADFVNLGTASVDGTELTHLQAKNPAGIDASALKNFGGGPLSGLEVWVDANDVVQKILVTSKTSAAAIRPPTGVASDACPSGFTLKKAKGLADAKSSDPRALCAEPETMTTTTEIDFANLGAPESITAPAGAIDQQMVG